MIMVTKEESVKSSEEKIGATDTSNIDGIELLLKAIKSDEKGSFAKLTITEDIFKKINENLIAIIKSMEKNPSIFARIAKSWGELPLWQKILGGVTLTVPMLIIGIVANIGFLLALCGITAVIYAGSGILLDDHHNCNTSATESLTKGILGLAELLELTIMALDAIRQKLEQEVNNFTLENEKLHTNVNELHTKIAQLDVEIKATHELALALEKTKTELEQTTTNLTSKITEQSDLLDAHQQQLKLITEAYHSSQMELDKKIEELGQVKLDLEAELSIANALAQTLGATLQDVTASLIGDKEQQKEMHQRITTFLNHKEASFASVATRICAAEEQLQQRTAELERCNTQYKENLEEQARQIQQLKAIIQKPPKKIVVSDKLSKMGVFAVDIPDPISPMTAPIIENAPPCH